MYTGIAILLDRQASQILKQLAFELNAEYGTGLDFVYLLQHVSLKQAFPYDGELDELEGFLREIFTGVEPFEVYIEKIEASHVEGKALVWLKVRESRELRALHQRLCSGLQDRFGIEPLGFDGDTWEFHSTIAYSEVDDNAMRDIISKYNNRELNLEFMAREAVMFCSLNMNPEAWLCFTPKRFKLGKD